ncbi:Glycoside hydrolase [Macleaya cordata]|uniref:Glycoside hydrolase n=1 Tax=Macleaya cordata TaxID=56857 RepID=A0A200PPR9_MACCD|nr:Glycoside hydrolase [Macleaya cordata]
MAKKGIESSAEMTSLTTLFLVLEAQPIRSPSSSYVEGAANEDGRTPSIWDTFTHAGKMVDKSNGDIACDQYHKYKEDVKLMADTGLDAYRFSISWSRLIPNGRGPVNPKGLQYYNNLINELISNGIQAHVTLFHYDLPQALEDEYGGWLSQKIVSDFTAYADVCFKEFGDRISTWTTLNEANVFVLGGYDNGIVPPQRCSSPFGINNSTCTSGNSTSEPYIAKQHGLIGFNVFAYWFIPHTNTIEDITATQRANDFFMGWFINPFVFGDYPEIVKKNAGSRIPSFTPHESKLVKGSSDFFGLNHYMSMRVMDDPESLKVHQRDVYADMAAKLIFDWDGIFPDEFPITPSALQGVLEYFKQVYGNPPMYIHENGQMTYRNVSLNDTSRVKYLEGYIGGLLNAVRNGSDTRGYFTWSFLDSFELLNGYISSFGLYFVDLNDPDLKRYPKLSAHWYSNFLKGGRRSTTNSGIIDEVVKNFSATTETSHLTVEGAVAEDGRKPCYWDIYTHQGKMADNSTGDVASDGYHKYKEDVKLMSEIGLEAYRFSISWSRLVPNGRGAINPKGVEYYNNLIDELISHGIQPHVTLYHLDLPQILEDEYGGWLSPKIIEDFTAYADVCFREFGDRVSHWTTINEPNIMAIASYDSGIWPPQRCSYPGGVINCTAGNSSIEPYTALHNILLTHATVAALYREKYKAKQNGMVGLNVYGFWCTSLTNSTADVTATQRANDFFVGWVVSPLVYGDYPEIMRKKAGSRLPSFTKRESELVKGSSDFLGLNHYFTVYIQDNPSSPETGIPDFNGDMGVKIAGTKDDTPTGQFVPGSLPSSPSGLLSLLGYLKDHYGNPPVYIQENGSGGPHNESLNDTARIDYVSGYIGSTLEAIRNGANTRGYFVWSFLDVFEVLSGYQSRYGLVHVDFEDKELKRQPKSSAQWYSNFLKKKKKQAGMEMKNINKSGSLNQTSHFSQ